MFTVDGFYPTGDLGYLDADGYLFFTGRRDDMFKVKGATVYPSEVEAALQANPDVQRALVVDLGEHPAQRVGALVVLAPGSDVAVDDLRADAAARLSAFKVPTSWAIVAADDVPMMATGKVDKSWRAAPAGARGDGELNAPRTQGGAGHRRNAAASAAASSRCSPRKVPRSRSPAVAGHGRAVEAGRATDAGGRALYVRADNGVEDGGRGRGARRRSSSSDSSRRW